MHVPRNGGFVEQATNGPYPLQVNGPWFTKSRIQKGFIRIRVDPQGDDTWKFSIVVKLIFEDGTSDYIIDLHITLKLVTKKGKFSSIPNLVRR